MRIENFLSGFKETFPDHDNVPAWELITNLQEILVKMIGALSNEFIVKDNVAIHKSAVIHSTAIIRGPAIISEDALIGCFALLRSGVFVGRKSVIGAHGEFKNS